MQRSIIAPAERVTNLRWAILASVAFLLFAVSFDGLSLVLGGWSDVDRIAFVAGAIVAQLPAGLLLDRFGVRAIGIAAGAIWVLATLAGTATDGTLHAAASAIAGMAASALLPLAAKAIAAWFPRSERGRATSIAIAAANLPIVLVFSPLLSSASPARLGLAIGGLATIATVVLAAFYREPGDARTTYAERTYIEDGGAQPAHVPALGALFASLARSRAVWALAFGFGAFSYAFGVGAVQVWSVPSAPFALVVNVLVGGWFVDALARGDAAARVRTIVLALGTLCGCATLGILGHGFTVTVLCTTLALIGFAAAQPVVWSLPGLLAPRGGTGTLAAIVALAGTLGATAVWWSGEDATGAAVAAVIAALVFAFALGRIAPIDDDAIAI